MKIDNYTIKMTSNHSNSKISTKEEKLRYWNSANKTENRRKEGVADLAKRKNDLFEISKEALEFQRKNAINQIDNENVDKANADNNIVLSISEGDKQKIRLLEAFIEKITGKKFKLTIIDEFKIKENEQAFVEKLKSILNPGPRRQGWGLEYNFSSTYRETEGMSFKAKGLINTKEGKTIDLNLQLNMNREFVSNTNIKIKAGDAAIDPLVINYSGKNLNLTDKKISFDINADGIKDNISYASEGSGFLSLDLNNDGKINDGKELFGPSIGDGFKELKQYDTDNNNWIDENDKIFNKLTIWTKDKNGNDKLFALGEVGIGAIYVGNINTEFSIKNSENTSLGKIQSSSVFLREDGSAGTIHHIDLSV